MHSGLGGRSAGNREIITDAFQPLRRRRALAYAPGNTVFTTMPKVACTSLQASLLVALGHAEFKDYNKGVHIRAREYTASDDQIANAAFTFTIHRDPFSRLASCFLDKIVQKPKKFVFDRVNDRKLDPDTTTFRDFVDWLAEDDNLQGNTHWQPQHMLLLYKEYDRYVQFSRMKEASGKLAVVAGFRFLDEFESQPHVTKRFDLVRSDTFADTPIFQIRAMQSSGICPAHENLYDASLVAGVAALYREDIELHASLFGRTAVMFSF